MKVHNKSDGRVRIRSSKKGPGEQSDTEIIDEQAHGSASVEQVLATGRNRTADVLGQQTVIV